MAPVTRSSPAPKANTTPNLRAPRKTTQPTNEEAMKAAQQYFKELIQKEAAKKKRYEETTSAPQPVLPAPPLRSPSRKANVRSNAGNTPATKKKTLRCTVYPSNASDTLPVPPVRASSSLRGHTEEPTVDALQSENHEIIGSTPSKKKKKKDPLRCTVYRYPSNASDALPVPPVRASSSLRGHTEEPTVEALPSENHDIVSAVSSHLPVSSSRRRRVAFAEQSNDAMAPMVQEMPVKHSVLSKLPRAPQVVEGQRRTRKTTAKHTVDSTLRLPRPPRPSILEETTDAAIRRSQHPSSTVPESRKTIYPHSRLKEDAVETEVIELVVSLDKSEIEKPSKVTAGTGGFPWLMQLVALYILLILMIYVSQQQPDLPSSLEMTRGAVSGDDHGISASTRANTLDVRSSAAFPATATTRNMKEIFGKVCSIH